MQNQGPCGKNLLGNQIGSKVKEAVQQLAGSTAGGSSQASAQSQRVEPKVIELKPFEVQGGSQEGDYASKNVRVGLPEFEGKDWQFTKINNQMERTGTMPFWNYSFQWEAKEPKMQLIHEAMPMVRREVSPNHRFVDDFSFPQPKKADKIPYEPPKYEIDRRPYYLSNVPKKLFVSSDGLWGSKFQDAPFPQLYYSNKLPVDNKNIKGNLGNIEVPQKNIVDKGEKEVMNNWKSFSEDELRLGPNAKLSEYLQRFALASADGAFDNVDFKQLGYSELGAPLHEEEMTEVAKMMRERQGGREESKLNGKKTQTMVENWVDDLRSREIKQGSEGKLGKKKNQEVYTISFSDVKQEPVVVVDSNAANQMNMDGTGWNYSYDNSGPSGVHKAQNFNNAFTHGTYGFESLENKPQDLQKQFANLLKQSVASQQNNRIASYAGGQGVITP